MAFSPRARVPRGRRRHGGTSSGVTDGAAMIVVAERRRAEALGVAPAARLLDCAVVGVPPRIVGSGPVPAIARLVERWRLGGEDIDDFEMNEAFAVVTPHAEKQRDRRASAPETLRLGGDDAPTRDPARVTPTRSRAGGRRSW